jgi:hypothetical protein
MNTHPIPYEGPVLVQYKTVQDRPWDTPRVQAIVYERADEFDSRNRCITYQKVVDIVEDLMRHEPYLRKWINEHYPNQVQRLDLRPAQPSLF